VAPLVAGLSPKVTALRRIRFENRALGDVKDQLTGRQALVFEVHRGPKRGLYWNK
jgi:hypothetical protein